MLTDDSIKCGRLYKYPAVTLENRWFGLAVRAGDYNYSSRALRSRNSLLFVPIVGGSCRGGDKTQYVDSTETFLNLAVP